MKTLLKMIVSVGLLALMTACVHHYPGGRYYGLGNGHYGQGRNYYGYRKPYPGYRYSSYQRPYYSDNRYHQRPYCPDDD